MSFNIRAHIQSLFVQVSRNGTGSTDVETSQRVVKDVGDLRVILASKHPLQAFLSLDATQIPVVVQFLQTEAQTAEGDKYRKLCMRCMQKLVKIYHILPPSLFVQNVTRRGDHPICGGGFSDIWKGKMTGRDVCLKVLRMHLLGDSFQRQKVLTKFCEEALLWTQLDHTNIVPLFGVNTSLFSPGFCLISPWFSHGNIMSYLNQNPQHDRLRAIYDIVAGLAYLHSHVPMIVHGDIKGANILVDDSLHCRLADFGLAAMTNESEQVFTSTTTGGVKGSFRWMAPELYQTGDTGLRLRGSSKSSRDMYAYGCTALEIITGRPPFPDLLDAQVMFRVLSGRRPERPQDAWCPNNIWDLIERCWDTNPFRRPSASVVHVFLEQLLASRETSDTAADSETEHMFLPTWDLVDNEEHADDSLTSPLTPVADANKATASQSGLTARDSELPPAYSSIVMPDDPGSIQPWLLDQQMQPKTWTPHTSIEGNDHFDLGRKSPPPEYQTHHSHKASPNAGDPTDQYTSTATLEDATPHAHHVSSSAMHTTFSDPVLSSPSYNSVTVGDAIVQRTYVPNLADGLAVTIDDTVRVLKTYHDGWALCEDSQQLLGMVPMEILEQTKSKTQDVGIDHGIARSASPNVLVLNSLEPLEEPPEVYCGWLSSLIQPLKRFITPANDFKDYYYDLQEISDTINGSVFLAKARIERISHTFLSKLHQPSVAKQTMVAIRCIFLVPSWTSALEELKHELSTLDGLSHANIHRIDALYIDFLDDSLWIRTELMKCRLSHILELVSKGIILREDAIATATADLVQALGFLRDHNIAHRNVKAENIWVNYDGVLKLGGFSESKCILAGADTWSPGGDRENSWQAPETLGSPRYYDPFKADIWSLGAIIYAFTQKNPALYSPKLDKFQRLCWYLPEDRPDIKSLAQHNFLIRSLSNGRGDLVELIKAHA